LGEKLEAADEGVLESSLKAPSAVKAKVLYVQNDGAMVSMQTGEWKEVKSAVLFTSDKHLKGTKQRRGQITDARYVSVLGDQEEFTKVLKPALLVANAAQATVVAWLADGARGNWNLASKLCRRAIQILDWFHAIEHAADCAKLLLGEGDACAELFRQRVGHLLMSGQVKLCIQELGACIEFAPSGQPLKALTELIGYYQHWGQRGGRRMARMRAAYRTAGFDRFFDAVHWAHRETTLYRYLPKPAKQRASNR
jgi:hypothetical protein